MLHEWLEVKRAQVFDSWLLAKAIDYALWNIFNTCAERPLRAVAVGRRNWVLIGNLRSGKGAAVLYSPVQNAKANGLERRTYLADVLERFGKDTDVTKLTPHGWRQHFATLVVAERDRFCALAVAER